MVGRILIASSTIERRLELRTALELEGHHVSETETAGQSRDMLRAVRCTYLGRVFGRNPTA